VLATSATQALAFYQVSAGAVHACGVTTDNRAYCWGWNFHGQLGDGSTTNHRTPVAVAGTLRFRQVSASSTNTCGVTTDNRAYCWGYNAIGQLGIGTSTGPESCNTLICSTKPVAVLGGLSFRQLSAGQVHTCGKTPADVAYCWGDSGTGSGNETTPTPVPGPTE